MSVVEPPLIPSEENGELPPGLPTDVVVEPGEDLGDGPYPRYPTPDDQVSRLLSASTYLQASFADRVTGDFLDPSHQATYPSWGMDTVLVARHALLATLRRLGRDSWLRAILTVAIVGSVGAVVLMFSGALSLFQAFFAVPLIWAVAWGLAFLVVWSHYDAAYRSAVQAAFEPKPPSPPVTDLAVEARLDELRDANVIVFTGNKPFDGSGVEVDRWTMTIDTSKGASKPWGRDETTPFDTKALYDELLREVPKEIHPPPHAKKRMFARGKFALNVPCLVREGPTGPAPGDSLAFHRVGGQVPEWVLDQYHDPHDHARVYATFQQSTWKGMLVVTMFVRAVQTANTLFVESSVHSLLPLRPVFFDVRVPANNRTEERKALLRTTAPMAWPLLVGSYGRRYRLWKAARRFKKNLRDTALDLERLREMNFGVTTSLRRDVGLPALDEDYPQLDRVRMVQELNGRVMDCLDEWLTRHKIDTAEFRRQRFLVTSRNTVNAKHVSGAMAWSGATLSDDGGD